MSGDIDENHPARKIDPERLMRILAERNEKVPALTARAIAEDFQDVKQPTVGNNLDRLRDAGEICSFNDDDVKVYWFPRDDEEGGTVRYNDLIDDSIDWDEVDVSLIPIDVAKEIASERLPYYRPRSFWSMTGNACQLGVMASFGLVILGIGGLVGGSYGIGENIGATLFRGGIWFSFISLIGYVLSLILENLAARGYVPIGPLQWWIQITR